MGWPRKNASLWFGLALPRPEEGWTWTDDTCYDYANWASGEPKSIDGSYSEGTGNEACAVMPAGDGRWNETDCESLHRFVCKDTIERSTYWADLAFATTKIQG